MLRILIGNTMDASAASAPQQCAFCTNKSHLNEHGCMHNIAYTNKLCNEALTATKHKLHSKHSTYGDRQGVASVKQAEGDKTAEPTC